MLTKNWIREDLAAVQLHAGAKALIRWSTDAIPGVSPRDSGDLLKIVVYSEDESKGWLIFSRLGANGSVRAIRNAYFLRRDGIRWVASEGNGGIGTYEAISRFVTALAGKPVQRTLLRRLGGFSCPTDEG